MSLARVTKQFVASNIGQLITLLTQLVTVPVFLYAYGASLYGQWLALAAALGYLSTLHYGLQTYAVTEMTILYNRDELQECRILESSALRMLLALAGIIALGLLLIFVIPVNKILHLSIGDFQAQLTLYFLGLTIVARALSGFTSGLYMVVNQPHRQANANNLSSVINLVALLGLAALRMPFFVLAGAQCLATLLWAGVVLVDLRRLAPELMPTIRYWRRGILGSIAKPSIQYMLLMGSNVLKYQLPLILIQVLLGPATVVVFSVTRTIYSMTRRAITLVTNSIGPEITITIGQSNLKKLYRLYDLSERLVLLMTVPVTLGTMFATPLFLKIWLHKVDLFDPAVALLLGATVAAQGLKEHKSQFQFSTNRIREMSYAELASYSAMLLASIPLMKYVGVGGFIAMWCVTELFQMFYSLYLNQKIFGSEAVINKLPIYKMCGFMTIAVAASIYPMLHLRQISYIEQGFAALFVVVVTGAISYWMFQVDDVRDYLWGKLSSRFPALQRGA